MNNYQEAIIEIWALLLKQYTGDEIAASLIEYRRRHEANAKPIEPVKEYKE
jgi:hypothetical protein